MRTLNKKALIFGSVLIALIIGGACFSILNYQGGYELGDVIGGMEREQNYAGESENPISPVNSFGAAGVSTANSLPDASEKLKSGMRQAPAIEEGAVLHSVAVAEDSSGGTFQGAGYGTIPDMMDKIIRKANLGVQIKKNKYEETYDKVARIVAAEQGYISMSRTNTGDGKITGGELAIRVPAGGFDDLMRSLKELGKVKSLEISSEEVSQEYVDLKSRLRNWRAQEAVMLDLMKRSKTISDSVMIQNNLQGIQMEIEQISGRLQFLDDRVAYSEINLSLNEPKIIPVKNTFAIKSALKDGLSASLAVFTMMIVLAGYLLPLFIAGGLTYVVYRQVKRRTTVKPVAS